MFYKSDIKMLSVIVKAPPFLVVKMWSSLEGLVLVCSGQLPWIAQLTWKKQLPQHSVLQYVVVVAVGSAVVTAS